MFGQHIIVVKNKIPGSSRGIGILQIKLAFNVVAKQGLSYWLIHQRGVLISLKKEFGLTPISNGRSMLAPMIMPVNATMVAALVWNVITKMMPW